MIPGNKKRRSSYQLKDDEASGLSSEQIWSNLNVLLGLAAKPVLENTYLGADLLISLLSASIDRRRKVSTLKAEDCRAVLFYSLILSPVSQLFDTLKNIGIERNLIFDPLLDSVSSGNLISPLLPNSVFDSDSLLRNVHQNLEIYIDFRSKVSLRYIRLAESMGKRNAWIKSKNGLVSDSGEHINNYMLAVLRAIDKFYPHKGTLASYIESWMANAAGSSLVGYTGEAFSIPRAKRKSIAEGDDTRNMSLPMEDALNIEDTITPVSDMREKDYVSLIEHAFSIKDCRPAWLDLDMPLFLTKADYSRILQCDYAKAEKAIIASVVNTEHILSISENINLGKAIKRNGLK
jgi:hypothetical protein